MDELVESFVMMPSLIVPCLESPNALVTEESFLAPHLNHHCSPETPFPVQANNTNKTGSKTRNVNSFLGLNLIPRLRHRNQYQKNLLFVNRSSTPVNALCQTNKKNNLLNSTFANGNSAGNSFHSDESDLKLLRGEDRASNETLFNAESLSVFAGKQSRTIGTGLNLMNKRNKNSVLSLPSFHSKFQFDRLNSKVVLASCEADKVSGGSGDGGRSDKVLVTCEDGCSNNGKVLKVFDETPEYSGNLGFEYTINNNFNGSTIENDVDNIHKGTLKKTEKRDRRSKVEMRAPQEQTDANEDLSNHDDETFGSRGTVIHCDMAESLATSRDQLTNIQPVSLSFHLQRSISVEDLAFSGKARGDYYSTKRLVLKSIFNSNKDRYMKMKEKKTDTTLMRNRMGVKEIDSTKAGGSDTRESTLEAPKRKNNYRHTVVLPFELDDGFATEPRPSHKKTPQQEPHMQLLDQYFYGSKTDSDYCSQHSKEFSSQFSSFMS